MTLRHEALAELLDPQQKERVLGLLLSARDVRIAVPCAVLNKGAGGAGSMVVINILRRSGSSGLALEAGRWWRGAPTTAVHMDYRQVGEARAAPAELQRAAAMPAAMHRRAAAPQGRAGAGQAA